MYSALIVATVSSIAILLSLVIYSRLFPPQAVAQAHAVVESYRSIAEKTEDRRLQRRARSMSLEYSRAVSLLRRALFTKIVLILSVYTTLLLVYTMLLEPLVPTPLAIPLATIEVNETPHISTVMIHFLVFMLAMIVFRETLR